MAKLPFILDNIAPSFFNPTEHVFDLIPSDAVSSDSIDTIASDPTTLDALDALEDDPRIVHSPSDSIPDPIQDPIPDSIPSDLIPPHVPIDEPAAFQSLRDLESQLLLSDADLTTTEFQTLTIIDHNQSFKFFDIPKQSRREFITLLTELRQSGSIIKLCEDAERTRDLSNLTKSHLQIISDNSHRLYNHKSKYLKDRPILLPSDAFTHIKKQLEDTAKVQKLSNKLTSKPSAENSADSRFKSAYAEWIDLCRKIKSDRQLAESPLLARKADLSLQLAEVREALRLIPERFPVPPAPLRSDFSDSPD